MLVWLLQHAVAGIAICATGLPGYVKWTLVLAIAVALRLSLPERSSILIVAADGTWRLPEVAASAMRLLPGSTFTRSWARLRLEDAGGRRCVRRIWFDVFGPDDRRRLLILLREHSHGTG